MFAERPSPDQQAWLRGPELGVHPVWTRRGRREHQPAGPEVHDHASRGERAGRRRKGRLDELAHGRKIWDSAEITRRPSIRMFM